MNTALGIVLALLTALDAPLTEPAPAAPLRGTLWERVQTVRAATLAMKPEDASLYDLFLIFSPKDLLTALSQGLEEVHIYNKQKPDAELKSMLLEVIEICVHAYPMVARTPEDRLVLLSQIEEQNLDPVYREYLILRMAPGLAPPSLFGDYVQQAARENLVDLNTGLGRLAYKSAEPEFIQLAAMESLYRLHYDSWDRLMHAEPDLARLLPPDGKLTPDLLSNAALKKLPDRTRKLAERKRADFQQVAQVLSLHFRPGAETTAALRAKALEIVKRLRAGTPLEDPAAVDAIIAGAEQAVASPPAAPQ